MGMSRPDTWHVQFDLHPTVEGDAQRIQALKEWKQEKRGVFVERMRSAIDRESGALQSTDARLDRTEHRLERMEKLLTSIHQRVMSGEIHLPAHEKEEMQGLYVDLQWAEKYGVVAPKGDK